MRRQACLSPLPGWAETLAPRPAGGKGEVTSQPASVGMLVLGPDHPGTLATRHEVARWTGRPAELMVIES